MTSVYLDLDPLDDLRTAVGTDHSRSRPADFILQGWLHVLQDSEVDALADVRLQHPNISGVAYRRALCGTEVLSLDLKCGVPH